MFPFAPLPRGALRCVLLVVFGFSTCTAFSSAAAETRSSVDGLKPWISLRFPGTNWVGGEDLAQWMLESSVVLLDSRTNEEFRVSHLKGALRVDPDVEPASLDHLPRDARVVVYCSVGYRSAAVARRLSKAGFTSVYNLDGGIFSWANNGRALFQGTAPASKVHPYDALWGKFLNAEFQREE